MKKAECAACGAADLSKNTVALNKKLLGLEVKNFYCLDCLADYLEVTVEELLEKIEEFQAEGCKLFE